MIFQIKRQRCRFLRTKLMVFMGLYGRFTGRDIVNRFLERDLYAVSRLTDVIALIRACLRFADRVRWLDR